MRPTMRSVNSDVSQVLAAACPTAATAPYFCSVSMSSTCDPLRSAVHSVRRRCGRLLRPPVVSSPIVTCDVADRAVAADLERHRAARARLDQLHECSKCCDRLPSSARISSPPSSPRARRRLPFSTSADDRRPRGRQMSKPRPGSSASGWVSARLRVAGNRVAGRARRRRTPRTRMRDRAVVGQVFEDAERRRFERRRRLAADCDDLVLVAQPGARGDRVRRDLADDRPERRARRP